MSELAKWFNAYYGPAVDDSYDLGAVSFRWKNFYLSGAVVSDTTTGVKFGTAATQKLGFFNATPIVQPSATTDLRQALVDLGLIASGGGGESFIGTLQLTTGTNFLFWEDDLLGYEDDVLFYN